MSKALLHKSSSMANATIHCQKEKVARVYCSSKAFFPTNIQTCAPLLSFSVLETAGSTQELILQQTNENYCNFQEGVKWHCYWGSFKQPSEKSVYYHAGDRRHFCKPNKKLSWTADQAIGPKTGRQYNISLSHSLIFPTKPPKIKQIRVWRSHIKNSP